MSRKREVDSFRKTLAAMPKEQRAKALLFVARKLAEIGWTWRSTQRGSKSTPTGSDWEKALRLGLTPRGGRTDRKAV